MLPCSEQPTIGGCQGVSCFAGSRHGEAVGVGQQARQGPETQRQRAVSVIVCGSRREELSPAQTEPTNAISVSNTIVLFSQANAIILSPVLWAHSAHKPQSQTFGPTLRLIFDVDKTHTIALRPMWPGRGCGGGGW